MNLDYKPHLIANFRTGFNEALEPWLLPRDAFQVMQNAHLYRGVVSKINGYDLYTKMTYRTYFKLDGVIDGVNNIFTGTLPSAIANNNFFGFGITVAGTQAERFVYSSDQPVYDEIWLDGSLGGFGYIDVFDPDAPAVRLEFQVPPVSIMPVTRQYNAIWFAYDSYVNTLSASVYPIMGIKPYFGLNGAQEIIVFDSRRAAKVVSVQSYLIMDYTQLDYSLQELPHEFQTAAVVLDAPFDGVRLSAFGGIAAPLVPGETVFKLFDNTNALLETVTDTGYGTLVGDGGATGTINYYDGRFRIVFTGAPAITDTLNAYGCTYGDFFTGNETNFFSTTNYQTKIFITNNKDSIRYYDGNCLKFLNTNLTAKPLNSVTYDITSCLHVEVYRERLELISPTIAGVDLLNTIYWSKAQEPLDFTNNERLPASTSDAIKAYKIINTDQIIHFSNSQWVFRYTGDAFSPFRWDSTNVVWRCDAPYGSISYDTYFSSIGRPGIVASDGVNVQRLDEVIPDFTDPNRIPNQASNLFLNQTYIRQCYGERFDDLKEGWLCYPSQQSVQSTVSDSVLAYNYLDETYAIYTFPFSCLGFGRMLVAETWGTCFEYWGENQETWGSFELTENALVDLAGDQYGNVFEVDEGSCLGSFKTGTISGITSAAPAVVTSASHGLNTGDTIILQGVVSTQIRPVSINNTKFTVDVLDENTFEINISTSRVFLYVSGGRWFTTPVVPNIITKDFNPFLEEGQLARLGYVDLLLSSSNTTTLRVQFYANNRMTQSYNTYYQETPITLTANGQTKVWKRIYCGAVAKAHTLRIYQSYEDFAYNKVNQPVNIHAIVPYFKPAGMIFN